MLARLIRHRGEDTSALRAEAVEVTAEQRALAPLIDAQTDYLVKKAEINGFTRQLRAGFARRSAEE